MWIKALLEYIQEKIGEELGIVSIDNVDKSDFAVMKNREMGLKPRIDWYQLMSRDYFSFLFIYFVRLCSVSLSCQIPCDPMDCSPPGSSVPGISQARLQESVVTPPLGDLPDPGSGSLFPPASAGRVFTTAPPEKLFIYFTMGETQHFGGGVGNVLMRII